MHDELARCWPQVVAAHTDLRDRLVDCYREPRRSYHDLRHLAEVFARIGEITAQTTTQTTTQNTAPAAPDIDLDAVLLAAWFHDAVYDGERDDEERSAQLALQELDTAGLPPRLVMEVVRLVGLTASHRVAQDDANGQVLCDADLGILAADERRYAEYTASVRREYAHLTDEEFRAGRCTVLRGLLDRPSLFSTDYARTRWESRARTNLDRELTQLDDAG